MKSLPQSSLNDLQIMNSVCIDPKSRRIYLEPFAPTEYKVAQWHADVVVDNFTMAFWCVVVSEDFHGSDDFNAWGVGRNENYTLLGVRVIVVGVALAHNDVDFCSRVAWTESDSALTKMMFSITCTANPPRNTVSKRRELESNMDVPFVSIDDDVISFLDDGSADIPRIRGRDCRV